MADEAERLLAEYVAGNSVLKRHARKIQQDQNARLVCLWAPHAADLGRILTAAKFVMITYLIDDMLDEGRTGFGATETMTDLKQIIDREKQPITSFGKLLADIVGPFLDGLGEGFRTRITSALDNWIDSGVSSDRPSRTMRDDEFLSWRIHNVGYEANIAVVEYCVGRDSSAHQEALRPLKAKAVEHVLVINDVYSYRRERTGDCVGHNILTLWMLRDGISLQQAVYRACDLAFAIECEYVAMEREIVSRNPQLASFAAGYRMLFQGNRAIHASGTRYNGARFRGNLLRGAKVRMDPDISHVIAYDAGPDSVGEPVPLPQRLTAIDPELPPAAGPPGRLRVAGTRGGTITSSKTERERTDRHGRQAAQEQSRSSRPASTAGFPAPERLVLRGLFGSVAP
ncbi:terpene synthase family protein [Streptomyces olivoreticuli]